MLHRFTLSSLSRVQATRQLIEALRCDFQLTGRPADLYVPALAWLILPRRIYHANVSLINDTPQHLACTDPLKYSISIMHSVQFQSMRRSLHDSSLDRLWRVARSSYTSYLSEDAVDTWTHSNVRRHWFIYLSPLPDLVRQIGSESSQQHRTVTWCRAMTK